MCYICNVRKIPELLTLQREGLLSATSVDSALQRIESVSQLSQKKVVQRYEKCFSQDRRTSTWRGVVSRGRSALALFAPPPLPAAAAGEGVR